MLTFIQRVYMKFFDKTLFASITFTQILPSEKSGMTGIGEVKVEKCTTEYTY